MQIFPTPSVDKVIDVLPRTLSGAPDFDVFPILVVPFQLLTPAWLQGSLISGSWPVCMFFVQMPSLLGYPTWYVSDHCHL